VPCSNDRLDSAIRAAWTATRRVVDHRDESQQPSDALAFLRHGVQELADHRSDDALAECAKRFEIVSGWVGRDDSAAARELAAVATELRALSDAV
jgi:hypothetical protein